jgi:NADH-quinone oxidoreductase subunit K
MCIEMLWLSASLLFLGTFLMTQNPFGLIFTIVILSVAAAETAIGLALLVNFYRSFKTLEITSLANLRG